MEVKRVGVVGSGIMGAGVAEVAAKAGFEVVVRSRAQAQRRCPRSPGREVAHQAGRQGDARGRRAPRRRWAASQVVTDLGELADCDLVLESIIEDLATKTHLFTELDRVCDDAAILATNTSTLPVVELAMATGRPERVCGIHFFNPAPAMSLVEVVRAITTSDETIATARAVRRAVRQDRRRRARPGRVHRERPALPLPEQRGEAARRGRRQPRRHRRRDAGRLQLPDGAARACSTSSGLDTSLAILEALYAEFKDPNYAPAPLLRRLVSAERYGRKSGAGFYEYRRR